MASPVRYLNGARTLALAVLLAITCPVMLSARTVMPGNSYVVLDLPDSFKPQSRFAGFFSADAGATIMVLDLPRAAYNGFTDHFERELERKGYSEVRHGKLPDRHDDHLFFFARQHTPVGQFDKYLLVFRNAKRAAYVTITVNPIEKVDTPLSYIEARNILSRARLSRHRAAVAKGYKLAYTGLFRERETVIGTTSVFVPRKQITASGSGRTGKPMLVVAPSLSHRKVRDLHATARALMHKFTRFRDMKLRAEEDVIVDGMKGYGLSGVTINKSDKRRMGIYQLVLANPQGGYFRIVGIAPEKAFQRYLDEFRRMAASFRLEHRKRTR